MTVEEISILISASAEQAITQLDIVASKLSALAGANGTALTVSLDTDAAEEKIAALSRSADQLLEDLSGNMTTAAALAAAQNDYEGAIDQLTTLKSLSRVTYEQELEYLSAIIESMEQYQLTAEEALDLEIRLVEAQAQVDAQNASSLDTLLDGVITALTARYESMRDAELEALEESKEAWEDWQESATASINEQIDALDELAEAEDRADTQEDYQRTITKLTEAIAYEQDDYNKAQLEKQLEEAQEAYEDWLEEIAREDQKTALEAQLEAVNEQAEAEIEALEAQAEAVSEAYDERLESAALTAEAELLLMESTQEELVALITEFAPDYNAAGQTLGEQLLEGFESKVGSISGWMENLNEMILEVQDTLSDALQEAAEEFYAQYTDTADTSSESGSVTITQQNTFNTPVETPSETAYRIQQANEALAEELLGY